jgi:hypothetical protein
MRTPKLYDEGQKMPIAPKGTATDPLDLREVTSGHFVAA